jgi:hypothetical protein
MNKYAEQEKVAGFSALGLLGHCDVFCELWI